MDAKTKTPAKTDEACSGIVRRLAPDKQEAWVGFLQAHSVITKALDAELVANHGLQLSTFEVLSRVAASEDGRLRMSDLAEQAMLSPSRISRLVSELETRKLLERRSCESDTRVVYAAITERGRELVGDVQDSHVDGIEARFFGGLSKADVRRLADLWPRVIAAAGGNTA